MLGYITIEQILIGVSVLLLLSLLASNVSGRFGIPALLVFLAIGMLAGSDGPGGIYFDDPWLAQTIGVVALIFILFTGGLETNWLNTRPMLKMGFILSTVGVLLTALILSFVVMLVTKFSFTESFLVGAIVSSTDAAAVFAILRSRNVSLKTSLKSLIELESGSNDPMAVFLTVIFTAVVAGHETSTAKFIIIFFQQLSLGLLLGYLAGRALVYLIRKITFDYEGLYCVLTIAVVMFIYGFTTYLGGSGFLAVYVVGLMLGKVDFAYKRVLVHFHGGLAWLMQIVMFFVLGLLVFPSKLPAVASAGLLIAFAMIFLARPASIYICLAKSSLSFKEKFLISWVGLRGAVPIVLATFPLLAGIPQANTIFNIVFFVVITSTIIQGPSLPFLSRWLKLDVPMERKPRSPLEFERTEHTKTELLDIWLPKGSAVIGKQLKEIAWPDGVLVVLINRGEEYIVPKGSTVLQDTDILFALVETDSVSKLNALIDEGATKAT